jgi:hypothetical protein
VDDPEVRAIARADALAAKAQALVPPEVVVEVRRDARWWVQLAWVAPHDHAAATRVVQTLEGAGLVLLSREAEQDGDLADRLSQGELLEVVER